MKLEEEQFMIVRIGNEPYGIKINDVKEVVPNTEITNVPDKESIGICTERMEIKMSETEKIKFLEARLKIRDYIAEDNFYGIVKSLLTLSQHPEDIPRQMD